MVSKAFIILYRAIQFYWLRKILIYPLVQFEGGSFWSETIRRIYREVHGIEIGYGTYGGIFNYRKIPVNTTTGNYCSIGKNLSIFNGNHPKEYFSNHPIFYNPTLGFCKKDMIERTSLTIGHDVWIGTGVYILPRVKSIGNGSMIGAGAVVTKDVPPYTIVAGNPAKVIGKRFSSETVERLEKSKWWEKDKDELYRCRGDYERIVGTKIC